MTNVLWKLNRLRAMGASEVLYRLRQTLHAQVERHGFARAHSSDPSGTAGQPWVAALPRNFDSLPYCSAADDVLSGRFTVFALKDVELGFPPQWNRCPKTGIVAPLEFGKTLNYRDECVVGDIKYLWEPNRHTELVTLAQAFHLTGDELYAEGCRTLLLSWFEQCPYPLGVNWTSSLEHAIRLVNWAVAWHLLAGWLGSPSHQRDNGDFRSRWLDSIHKHCHFIAGHFSRYSSANNHLLGELMGLLIGSVVWPLWPESKGWRLLATREFELEVLKQNSEDGVNREQAIWYHHEVADMMLLAGFFGRENGIQFSPAFWQRLEEMLEFIASLMDCGGHVPMLGDADDATMVRFANVDVFRSLLATGAVLFKRGDFKAKAGYFDDKSRWLLGDAAELIFRDLPEVSHEEPRRDFPVGGYAVLGDGFGTSEEVRIVCDDGPLGYLSIAAHGHSDALSTTLSIGGHEILVDPGTYAYHAARKWRDYFKGTSAHNTVRIDRVDQSISEGKFLWVRHAQAHREHFETTQERDAWTGSHNGYLRLHDPVLHRRTVELDKRARLIRVTDRLECNGSHWMEVFWHAHEGCQVVRDGSSVRLTHGSQAVTLCMPSSNWTPMVVHGCDEPPLGWVSRRFDERVASNTIIWAGEIDGTTEMVTVIAIELSVDGRTPVDDASIHLIPTAMEHA